MQPYPALSLSWPRHEAEPARHLCSGVDHFFLNTSTLPVTTSANPAKAAAVQR